MIFIVLRGVKGEGVLILPRFPCTQTQKFMRKLLSFLMAFCFLAPIFFGSCEKMTEDFNTGEASIEVLRNYKMIPVIDTLYQKETIIKVDTLVIEKEGKTDTLVIRDTIKVPEYVPVIKIDTVYVRDTITNTITDTVYKERVVYDTVYVEKTKIDTVFVNKTDTLYVDVEVEIEKPIYIRDTVKIEVIIRDTTYILPDGAYYGKPYVGGKETAYLPEFIFVDGVHVETNLIPAKFKFQLTAGNPILVGATPVLTNDKAAVNNNTFSYLYYAGNNVFDSWMVDFNREVTFVTSDGKSIKHTLTENWEPMSLAYYKSSDLTWDHLSAATINNIIQDTDVQQLYMMPKSPEYTFAHEHKNSKVLTAEMQIRDTHNGIVLENGKAVERAAYDALHQVSHSQSNAIEYNSISSVENRVFTLDNGVARIANATVVEDVKLIECDNLYMETTDTWYCHPAFPTSGAEAVLGCCQPEAISIRTGKYNGENLPATLIVKGEQEKEFPIILTTEPKPVIQPDVHGVEFADGAEVTGPNSSTLIAYPTINGVRTGEEVKLTSSFSGSLVAGAQINKTSNGSVNLSNTNARVSGSSASFTYNLDGSNFSDAWKLSTQANATFTYDKNGVKETVTKPIKANVTVKSTQFTGTNGTYRNTASLYADGFAIASDTQVIVVNKPQASLIEGYTVIAAYITTCYHKGDNDELVNDGNQLAIVARKNNDDSKYIIRRANAETGAKIQDYNVNNVDESKIFSFRTVEGKLKPAYLDVSRTNNQAASWAYQDISSFNENDTNTFFAVSKWYVINYGLTDPLIEVGKVENGYVTINGLRFK